MQKLRSPTKLLGVAAVIIAFAFSGNAPARTGNDTAVEIHPSAPVPGSTFGWLIETVDTGGVGNSSSIALDSSGNPHISYFDFANRHLKYASKTDSGWVIETVDEVGDIGQYSSLKLGSQDWPHISYCECLPGDCNTCSNLKYAYFLNGYWNKFYPDSTAGNAGGYTSQELLSGHPHITYYDYDAKDLKYYYMDTLDHIETLDSTGDVGIGASMAFGFDKRYITYYDKTNQHLKLAIYNGASWSTGTIDSTTNTGAISSIDLCRESGVTPGGFYILYFSNGDLKLYQAYASGGVHTEILNHESPSGISLKLDPGCKLRASYYNVFNGDLKFIYYDNGFHTEVVDDEGDSWYYYSSLAVDSYGNPHISYYDDSEGFSLRYAYKSLMVFLPVVRR